MKSLKPVPCQSKLSEPDYPSRQELHRSPQWKKIAMAIGTSACLLFPCCGENQPSRPPGEPEQVHTVDPGPHPDTLRPGGIPRRPIEPGPDSGSEQLPDADQSTTNGSTAPEANVEVREGANGQTDNSRPGPVESQAP